MGTIFCCLQNYGEWVPMLLNGPLGFNPPLTVALQPSYWIEVLLACLIRITSRRIQNMVCAGCCDNFGKRDPHSLSISVIIFYKVKDLLVNPQQALPKAEFTVITGSSGSRIDTPQGPYFEFCLARPKGQGSAILLLGSVRWCLQGGL
ncbi:hypothetical protein VNO77_34375 [Canavalia gladiata]|uniref:Uncharacterized protein n=1 Tax=Canavalia gladiata TaxID=3824 RepID=A0AAN9PZ72_CANGL